MKRPAVLWTLAVLVTLASAVYQRMTGPTHPLRGRTKIGGEEYRYRLERSWAGESDALIRLPVQGTEMTGTVSFRKSETADSWTTVEMQLQGNDLTAPLPHQPLAGKLDYKVMLRSGAELVWLNGGRPVTMRFKGDVPVWVLAPHVLAMFLGMLLANRAGLAAFFAEPQMRVWTLWTVALITAGGMMLGPVVQKFAFGEAWTGWPKGVDLTDNKTAIAWLLWVVAAWRRSPRWVVAAALVTLAVFLIPHSVLSGNVTR